MSEPLAAAATAADAATAVAEEAAQLEGKADSLEAREAVVTTREATAAATDAVSEEIKRWKNETMGRLAALESTAAELAGRLSAQSEALTLIQQPQVPATAPAVILSEPPPTVLPKENLSGAGDELPEALAAAVAPEPIAPVNRKAARRWV